MEGSPSIWVEKVFIIRIGLMAINTLLFGMEIEMMGVISYSFWFLCDVQKKVCFYTSAKSCEGGKKQEKQQGK